MELTDRIRSLQLLADAVDMVSNACTWWEAAISAWVPRKLATLAT